VSAEPVTFELVWERIAGCEREFFQTHQNRWFTYRLEQETLLPSQTDLRISRADFERVFPMLPLRDARKIAKHVTGYPYVAAVLGDKRISKGAW
jgi:hypothetical protein